LRVIPILKLGKLHEDCYYFDINDKEKNNKTYLYKVKETKLAKKEVTPVYEQKKNESRYNWYYC
jgi:hypothetical protein